MPMPRLWKLITGFSKAMLSRILERFSGSRSSRMGVHSSEDKTGNFAELNSQDAGAKRTQTRKIGTKSARSNDGPFSPRSNPDPNQSPETGQLISEAAMSRAMRSLLRARELLDESGRVLSALDGGGPLTPTLPTGPADIGSIELEQLLNAPDAVPSSEEDEDALPNDYATGEGGDDDADAPQLPTEAEEQDEGALNTPIEIASEPLCEDREPEIEPAHDNSVAAEEGSSADAEPDEEMPKASENEELDADAGPEEGALEVPAGEEPDTDGEAEDETPVGDRDSGDVAPRKRPRKYKPQKRRPKLSPQPGKSTSTSTNGGRMPSPALLRITRRKGQISSSFLLRRGEEMPKSLTAYDPHDETNVDLEEYGDDWFKCSFNECGRRILGGFELEADTDDSRTIRWLLNGREIFVLGQVPDIAGWVQVPWVVADEDHMVLCVEHIFDQALEVIKSTGSPEPAKVSFEEGLFDGWILCEGVHPETLADGDRDGTITDVLKPSPEVKISFVGGIKRDSNTWLKNHHPKIQVSMKLGEQADVLIDGHLASPDGQGFYTVPGCFETGNHTVFVVDAERTYEIVEPGRNWEKWPAFSLCREPGQAHSSAVHICGPLAWLGSSEQEREAVIVPEDVPVLLGDVPGQVCICISAATGTQGFKVGFPHFKPSWAVPLNPLTAPKYTKILSLSPVAKSKPIRQLELTGRTKRSEVARWSRLIRESGYRKLRVKGGDEAVLNSWKEFGKLAKSVGRAVR
jgi:hypothetical protein